MDAPVIAAGWQTLFARDAGVKLSLASRAALPLAVWLIYLVDRLLDTRSGILPQATARHQFYYTNRQAAYLMTAVAATAIMFALFYLPGSVLNHGLAVLCLVMAYLMIVHGMGGDVRRWLPKEAAVGLIFSIGAVLAPITLGSEPMRLLFPALLFGILCWANSAAIELWEGGTIDCVSTWIARHMTIVAMGICLLCLAGSILSASPLVWIAMAVGSLGHCAVDHRRADMHSDLLRVSIDIPLLAPLLLLGLR